MSEKVEQALYWPETMLHDIRDQAARLDTSLSWCVQRAWHLGRKTIAALPSVVPEAEDAEDAEDAGEDQAPSSAAQAASAAYQARYAYGGDKRKQTLYFPEEMLAEIRAEAQRLDRSLSWVVQHAWALAYDRIAALAPHQDD